MSNMSDGSRPFQSGTGFLLARLGALASASWAAALGEHGVTQTQHAVLVVIRSRRELGQGALAGSVGVDGRNLVAVLDAMEARGLVARTPDPADGRRRVVGLTAAGEELADRLIDAGAEGRDDFLAPLDADERRELNRLLLRVYDARSGR